MLDNGSGIQSHCETSNLMCPVPAPVPVPAHQGMENWGAVARFGCCCLGPAEPASPERARFPRTSSLNALLQRAQTDTEPEQGVDPRKPRFRVALGLAFFPIFVCRAVSRIDRFKICHCKYRDMLLLLLHHSKTKTTAFVPMLLFDPDLHNHDKASDFAFGEKQMIEP